MAKVVIECEDCRKKKRVTKRHKLIVGNQCNKCLKNELLKDRMSQVYEDLYS